MGCTIDHLISDHWIRILKPFTDLQGMAHAEGEKGVLKRMDLDWARQEVVLEWQRDGRAEAMRFALAARSGPRSGDMRAYFELGEPVAIPNPARESRRLTSSPCPNSGYVPLPAENEAVGPDVYDAGFHRVLELAARMRFDEAEKQVLELIKDVGEMGWKVERLADDLGKSVAKLAPGLDTAALEWLCDRAVHLWYHWGSMATSGGEGAEKSRRMKPELKRLEELLERYRVG